MHERIDFGLRKEFTQRLHALLSPAHGGEPLMDDGNTLGLIQSHIMPSNENQAIRALHDTKRRTDKQNHGDCFHERVSLY